MERCQGAECVVLVACSEISDQEGVSEFVKRAWKIRDVRVVADSAPEKALAETSNVSDIERLRERIEESREGRFVKYLGLVAQGGPGTNGRSHDDQIAALRKKVDRLAACYTNAKVVGIWLDENGNPLNIEL